MKTLGIRSYTNNIRNSSEKSLLRGLGLSDGDLEKPRIAIINTWNEISPAHIHLDTIAKVVKEGILEAGGLPFHFNVTNLCADIDEGPYVFASRDLMCNEIETIMDGCQLDAMVLLAACDKTIPGVLMGAARLDLPAVIVTGGYLQSLQVDGRVIDSLTGDNTMCFLTESMGMSMPGNATVASISPNLKIIAREAGRTVMSLWRNGITARQIITEKSITNAIKVCAAIGCPTSTMIHIPAIAAEAGISMDCWYIYDRASHEIPLLMHICPASEHMMFTFEQAGGMRSLLNEIHDHLYLDCVGVHGKSVRENIEGYQTCNTEVIHPLSNPLADDGGICILKGNIAPEGCIAKQSNFPRSMLKFCGPARVFFNTRDACKALCAGTIKVGDAIVIMMMGAKGGPGIPTVHPFATELAGAYLMDKVCLITDGRLSDMTQGAAIGYCSPEAGLDGPLCAVRDGDIITYDLEFRTIHVELSDEEIARRISSFDRKVVINDGFIGMYQRSVTSLRTGAILVPTGAQR